MRHWYVGGVMVLFAALGLSSATHAQEAVKLEYKLKPGTELRYKTEGTLTQKLSTPQGDIEGGATITATSRLIVAEVDPETGIMLIGELTSFNMDIKMTTPQGEQTRTQKQIQAKAFRVDSTGKAVEREAAANEEEGRPRQLLQLMRNQLDKKTLDHTPLPTAAIVLGQEWKSELGLPLMGSSVPCKAVTTLSEIKDVEGARCALIKSELSTAETAGLGMPNMDISGQAEMLFDIERGMSLEKNTRLTMKPDAPGIEGEMTMETVDKLESVRVMPEDEAARFAELIRGLDSALTELHKNEIDKAIEHLDKLRTSAVEEDWKKGLEQTLTMAKQMRQFAAGPAGFAPGEEEKELGPADKLMKAAETAAKSGNWKEAASKYAELAEKHPDHELVPMALSEAASIYEQKLNDRKAAAEIRRKLIAMQEEKAASDPMQTYRLAKSYADAGDLEKAVEAYRRVAASDSKDVPARTRMLAQYRAAGLLEKMGRAEEALKAYRAMENIAADDDYSKKIKENARKKAAELAAEQAE